MARPKMTAWEAQQAPGLKPRPARSKGRVEEDPHRRLSGTFDDDLLPAPGEYGRTRCACGWASPAVWSEQVRRRLHRRHLDSVYGFTEMGDPVPERERTAL